LGRFFKFKQLKIGLLNTMLFKQIKGHGSNFSYVIVDENTREAAIVDPDFNSDEVETLLTDEKLKLVFIINTHDHIDHVIGNDTLKLRFGAKTVAHRLSKIATDVKVDEGDLIRVGITFRSKFCTHLDTAMIASAYWLTARNYLRATP
jgi:glyoxylase-like metal-dependent hydrolase (beta-lactamase superfamily II)